MQKNPIVLDSTRILGGIDGEGGQALAGIKVLRPASATTPATLAPTLLQTAAKPQAPAEPAPTSPAPTKTA